MGLKWELSEDNEVISNLKNNMTAANEFASDLSTRVNAIVAVVDGGELTGRSYNAAKSLFSELLLPIARAISVYVEDLDDGISKYKSARNVMDGTGQIDEEQIKQSIKVLDKKIQHLSTTVATNPSAPSQIISAGNHRNKLAEKIKHLHEFNSKTSTVFNDDAATLNNIMAGIKYINKGSLDGKGNFQPALGSTKDWLVNLNNDSARMLVDGISRPKGMSSEEFKKFKAALVSQAIKLMTKGWAPDSVRAYAKYLSEHEASYAKEHKNLSISEIVQSMTKKASKVGSKLFLVMWDADKVGKGSVTHAQSKLTLLMKITKMPEQLSGSKEEAKKLLKRFGNIAPDNAFWNDLAKTVRKGFPKGLFISRNTVLAQKIHQFRYVISAQQIQYIRNNYAVKGGTDRDALINYLSDGHTFSTSESARLHQKLFMDDSKTVTRGANGYKGTNIKIVEDFQTEFMLDGKGNLINEVDPEKGIKANENGVVNGASFNYAKKNDYVDKNGPDWNLKNSQHYKYDIYYKSLKRTDPNYKNMDPKFRIDSSKGFVTPGKDEYKDTEGKFSVGNSSAKEYNKKAQNNFSSDVNEATYNKLKWTSDVSPY